jgi:hypothetical protein
MTSPKENTDEDAQKETHLGRHRVAQRSSLDAQAGAAAAALNRAMTGVRLDHSIHLTQDETSPYVFDAPTSQIAALAAEQAGLDRSASSTRSPDQQLAPPTNTRGKR